MAEWWMEDLDRTHRGWPDLDREEAVAAAERLLARPGLPAELERTVRQNLTWYLPELPGERRELDVEGLPEGWAALNPSIAVNPAGELACIVRSTNYELQPDGRYLGPWLEDGVIRTVNYLGRVSSSHYAASNFEQIRDEGVRPAMPLFCVSGFEDARLSWWQGRWQVVATTREYNERGICQQASFELHGAEARRLAVRSPAHDVHQKNWMPVGEQGFISHCYPTTLVDQQGRGHVTPAPYLARGFRGGALTDLPSWLARTCGLGDARWLGVVHESVDFSGGSPHRVYWHRLVTMTDAPRLLHISPPFQFERRGVEFAAGIAVHGENLLISYGVGDSRTMLHLSKVESAIRYLFNIS